MALLNLRHLENITTQLSSLIEFAIDAVESGVAIDPGGKTSKVISAQFGAVVAFAQQVNQAAAEGTVLPAGSGGLNLITRAETGHEGFASVLAVGTCAGEIAVPTKGPIGFGETVVRCIGEINVPVDLTAAVALDTVLLKHWLNDFDE